MKKIIQSGILTVFALCLCFAHPVMAEDMDAPLGAPVSSGAVSPAADPSVSEATVPMMPQVEVKAEKTEDGKYYLDFKSASLINVLNVLSNLSRINFIAGTEVAERQVSMTLDNVVLEDVLQAISYGCNVSYDFLPGRNIYLFRASSDAPDKPSLLTRVYKLYYVKVSKLKEIEATSSGDSSGSSSSGSSSSSSSGGKLATLQGPKDEENFGNSAIVKAVEKILSERGKVSVDDRSNSLIVTDSEDRLKMIESAIAQLDRPLDQVLINVILVETFEDLDRSLGIQWGDAEGTFGTITGAVEQTQWPFRTNSPESKSFFGNLGNTFKDTAKQFNPTNNSGVIPAGFEGTRDFSSFQIQIKAMEDANKLKILAKPKILALDNQAALIKIATDSAIGTSTTTTGSTTATETSIERFETGTILRVTPLINTGGRITLTVEPTFATVEQSAIAVTTTQTGDPTVRTARTTLMVNDGQTIALGGMLFSQQSNEDRKVPFFGNIPVIGKAFFTSNTKSIKDRELILFVTPYIITDPSMLYTLNSPDKKLSFDEEIAPFWKVKDKQWYKTLKDGPEKKTDFDGYFNIRKRLIDSTLDTLDQNAKSPASSPK